MGARVVHISNLPRKPQQPIVTEIAEQFGTVVDTIVFYGRGKALVQFATEDAARAMMSAHEQTRLIYRYEDKDSIGFKYYASKQKERIMKLELGDASIERKETDSVDNPEYVLREVRACLSAVVTLVFKADAKVSSHRAPLLSAASAGSADCVLVVPHAVARAHPPLS